MDDTQHAGAAREELQAALQEINQDAVPAGTGDPVLMRIPPQDLKFAAYQREPSRPKIEWMVKNWEPGSVGVLVCNFRDNEIWCIDGRHRAEAAILRSEATLLCLVTDSASYEDEARSFKLFNARRKAMGSMDLFNADLEAKDPDALNLVRVIREVGYRVPLYDGQLGKDANTIVAIAAVRRIYEWGGEEGLKRTLEVVRETWGGEPKALDGIFLKAVYQFLDLHKDEVTLPMFLAKMRMIPVAEIMRFSAIRVANERVGSARARYLGIVDAFNSGRRGRRLLPKKFLNVAVGEESQFSKLTEEVVISMLREWDAAKHTNRTITEIAEEYGLPYGTVRSIVNRETWKHVDPFAAPGAEKPSEQSATS